MSSVKGMASAESSGTASSRYMGNDEDLMTEIHKKILCRDRQIRMLLSFFGEVCIYNLLTISQSLSEVLYGPQ